MNRYVLLSSLSRFLIGLFLGWCVIVVGTGAVQAAPDITTITPNEGPEAGGTAVTVGGTGFESALDATSVHYAGMDNEAEAVATEYL